MKSSVILEGILEAERQNIVCPKGDEPCLLLPYLTGVVRSEKGMSAIRSNIDNVLEALNGNFIRLTIEWEALRGEEVGR